MNPRPTLQIRKITCKKCFFSYEKEIPIYMDEIYPQCPNCLFDKVPMEIKPIGIIYTRA
jgi:hypothetical protein